MSDKTTTVPNTVLDIVQTALDGVREDLIDLRNGLEAWTSTSQPDVAERVANWLFNTQRRMSEAVE